MRPVWSVRIWRYERRGEGHICDVRLATAVFVANWGLAAWVFGAE
jgi:hypothetical protein